MHQSHGMGYAEYSQEFEKRMDVEKRREEEYHKSQKIQAEFDQH